MSGARRGAPRPPPARRGGGAEELRVFGLNACLALFRARPAAVRKVWLEEQRLGALREVLAWCARERIGYRIVSADDLERLTRSSHHEGVCFEARIAPPRGLGDWLGALAPGPAFAAWLDGVGNPHNFGAVLRIGAHFGAAGVLLPPGSGLRLSGAACRVAEGGAEAVPLVALGEADAALAALAAAGLEPVATVVRGGEDLYGRPLPARMVAVFGAETSGMSEALLARLARRVRIPGSGAVESLNIATAVGVLAAEHWRQHRRRG